MFFIFPIAFTLNRLGQHYDIDPTDPAKWGTLMRGHWFWDFAFLNSNYHLEHHYFPGVPFYRLPALQRALVPVLRAQADAVAELRPARLWLARREPRASHGLESQARVARTARDGVGPAHPRNLQLKSLNATRRR